MNMSMKDFLGKNIYTKLLSDRIYQGVVQEVTFTGTDDQNKEIYIFLIKDKFNLLVSFSSKEIKYIEEQKEKYNGK